MTVTTVAQPTKARSPLLLVGAALAIVYVVWGSTYLAIRIMVEEIACVNPLVAVCLGWLILAEPVTMPTLLGGVIVVLRGRRRRALRVPR